MINRVNEWFAYFILTTGGVIRNAAAGRIKVCAGWS